MAKLVDLHEACPEGGEFGTPPLLVEKDYACPECGATHLLEECPDCGSRNIHYGHGLGFGPGYGQYKYCDCGWSWKEAYPDSADG